LLTLLAEQRVGLFYGNWKFRVIVRPGRKCEEQPQAKWHLGNFGRELSAADVVQIIGGGYIHDAGNHHCRITAGIEGSVVMVKSRGAELEKSAGSARIKLVWKMRLSY